MTPIYGFRVAGPATGERRLIAWRTAFAAACGADPRVEPDRESYLSAFAFGEDFAGFLRGKGTTRGYAGPVALPYVFIDLDGDANDLTAVQRQTCLLLAMLEDRLCADPDRLGVLLWFSGGKGFHVAIPGGLFGLTGEPIADGHGIAKRMAGWLAEQSNATIDVGVYDRQRLFRAPNSRHARTGLYKVAIPCGDLAQHSPDSVRRWASEPRPMEPPNCPAPRPEAVAWWRSASGAIDADRERRRSAGVAVGLQFETRAFLAGEAVNGERAIRLFRAAANLAELGCPDALADALLSPPARDGGLTPAEVSKQIRDGLAHGRRDWRAMNVVTCP